MGNFYTSLSLRGPARTDVLDKLSERSAYVSGSMDGFTTILDEECESQDPRVMAALAQRLSAELHCPVLATLNHDDDFLFLMLFEDGSKTDEYNSNPAAFSEDEDAPFGVPQGGDAARLCAAFGSSKIEAVEAVLRDEAFMMAVERHARLAAALGLPAFSVGVGFHYASGGELPDGTPPEWYELRPAGN